MICQRHDDSKIFDSPASWRSRAELDHAANDRDTEQGHPFEVPEDLVETNTETLPLNFLSSSSSFHLDGKEVAEESNGKMNWDATEEDEHWSPFDYLDDEPEETLFSQSVSKRCKCERRLFLC